MGRPEREHRSAQREDAPARASRWVGLGLAAAASALLLAGVQTSRAARIADVSNTKHNLSVTGPGPVTAVTETQICVFCHTPHHAENIPAAPLWNRRLSQATYATYSSSSIEANAAELAAGPGGSSKLCLSCHDGTMAIANVDVLNGQRNATINLGATTGPGGTMPPGPYGAQTGFTRNLGVDLTNDHPISFTYDAALAAADGELRTPDGVTVGTRASGVKPKLPLEAGRMQCVSCHDPHLRETDPAKGSAKFLRGNRFQEQQPGGGAFSEANDIICLGCHDKGGQLWALSAHANRLVADETYSAGAAALREFPPNLPVWKAACLNCHDTHTVQGARRLLREGTDSPASPKSGGDPALEETCYQCHSALGSSVLTNLASVPNIKDDFALTYRMPITDVDQQAGAPEVHDIGTGTGVQRGKDMVESPTLLGKGAPANRHVECTDCHNPHRVTKNRRFNANAAVPEGGGTHEHGPGHSNIASGVLRGTTGVEPVYGPATFLSGPTRYDFKRGDGGTGADTAAGNTYVTREYQVCLKCHSDFAYDVPPALGLSGGGTGPSTNGVERYTNQAMEFQAPANHRAGGDGSPTGAAAAYLAANHRSWHPVLDSTGRGNGTAAGNRGTVVASWRAPWGADADVGTQTMYCSDCHGSGTVPDSVVPDTGRPWGPHGSSNPFILKGEWSGGTGTTAREGGFTPNALCFKCHNPNNYADRNGVGSVSARTTGFYNGSKGNLHAFHTDKIEQLRCTWCHVAVPHGWKNKALLVNLNDVGPEALCRAQDAADLPTPLKCTVGQPMPPGTQMRNGPSGNGATSTTPWRNRGYSNPPYYLEAMLKIRSFAASGSWTENNCGSAGTAGNPGNGEFGKTWMRDSSESCSMKP